MLVKESIVRNVLGKVERRTRQKKAAPAVSLGQLRYKILGPSDLTKKERTLLLRKVLASEGVCLCNRDPFVNFERPYLRALITGTNADRAQHAITAWQNVKFDGKVAEKVLVGFALFRPLNEEGGGGGGENGLLMQAICSCRAFDVTSSLFARVRKLARQLGTTTLHLDSLPHVCYYYFAKKEFQFVDASLNAYMTRFGKFLNSLSTDDKLRMLGYLSNLSIANKEDKTRENKRHCLEGFLYMTNTKDKLFRGKVIYRDFMRAAYQEEEGASSKRKNKKKPVPMLDVIAQLARNGIPMVLRL